MKNGLPMLSADQFTRESLQFARGAHKGTYIAGCLGRRQVRKQLEKEGFAPKDVQQMLKAMGYPEPRGTK